MIRILTAQASAANDNISVEITAARLITKWVLPPPRLVSAALTQSVNYATYDVLRFRAEPDLSAHGGIIVNNADAKFTLNSVSFPYMPSLFVFSVMPHYAHCTDVVAGRDSVCSVIDSYKKDKRPCIYKMDLSINTSSSTVQHDATSGNKVLRYNARDLYNMTLKNCASMESFPYSFEEWMYNCGIVALTPAQLSGNLNSQNIRGNVVVQGDITCRNRMGCPMNIKMGSQLNTQGDGTLFPGANVPRYRCMISGFYSNRSLILDAKSGLLQESTFSQAMNQSLRTGS